jgi:hypothetical protein
MRLLRLLQTSLLQRLPLQLTWLFAPENAPTPLLCSRPMLSAIPPRRTQPVAQLSLPQLLRLPATLSVSLLPLPLPLPLRMLTQPQPQPQPQPPAEQPLV